MTEGSADEAHHRSSSLRAYVGCLRQASRALNPAGVGFSVDRLFTHEGCTVYRFGDAGEYRYFTKCDGAASSSSSWSETRPCGKSQCRDAREIPTAYERPTL